MPIDACMSVGMSDIYGLAVSSVLAGYTRHISVGNTSYGMSDCSFRLEIKTVMKMVWPQFAEIGAEQ